MFTVEEKDALIEEIGILASKYFDENISTMSSPNFEQDIHNSILSILEFQLGDMQIPDLKIELDELIYYTLNTIVYKYYIHRRKYAQV